MWNQPWKLAEGFLIGAGLIVTGLLLQFTVGPIDWNVFSFPANIIVLAVFLFLIGMAFAFRKKVYAFRFLASYLSAIPALCYAVVLTAVMGLTRQVPGTQPPADALGLTRMLSFWPFVLIYVWIAFILGMVTLKRLASMVSAKQERSWKRDVPFLLNHLGLFITMLSATLGNADMQRLRMTINSEGPEWRATDDTGRMHELPIAIQLEDFRIDEYPPKLTLIDNHTGHPVGGQQAETLLLDSTFSEGQLGNWRVRLNKLMDYAAPVMKEDTTYYDAWMASGAVTAVHVDVDWHPMELAKRRYVKKSGWITCGSYRFPYQLLAIDDHLSLAMLPRIYQLNYDTTMGRWSEISVLELVRDPWLPVVYTGIAMMLLGALCMFFMVNTKKS